MTPWSRQNGGLRLPAPRIGIVSSRHRLCAASRRPLHEASALLAAQVAAASDSGVEFFQVREPDLDGGALLVLVRALVRASRDGVRIVVNDRADVAAATGAGLHLKSTSMAVERLRPWLPSATWISIAVHGVADLSGAVDVDAVVAGTVRDTPSKAASTPRLGLDGLAQLVASTPRPVFAIGGLTADDWPGVAAAGAVGLAAIGWMLPHHGEDPGAAVARAMARLRAVVDGGHAVS